MRFVELSEAQARERWRQQGMSAEMADVLASWQGSPHPATDTVERVLGRPARSFARWVAAHVSHFQDG